MELDGGRRRKSNSPVGRQEKEGKVVKEEEEDHSSLSFSFLDRKAARSKQGYFFAMYKFVFPGYQLDFAKVAPTPYAVASVLKK